MQTTAIRCGSPECRRLLDERSDLAVEERQPCPACGSLARVFEVSGTATLRLTASVAWTKIHEEIERDWPWLLLSLALTVTGSLVGLVLHGLTGLLIGLALGVLSFPAGLRAATRIREIEHGRGG